MCVCVFCLLSFSWLSWQVHRSIAVLLRGSTAVSFHKEFHRLLSSSKPVPGFVTYITVTLPQLPTFHAAQNANADVSKSTQAKTVCRRAWNKDDQNTQTKGNMSVLSNPQSSELECNKGNIQPRHRADTGEQMPEKPSQLYPKPLVQPVALQSVSVGKPKHAVCTQDDAQTNVEPLEKNQTHIQSHLNPLCQTHISYIQSQLTSLTVTATTEKNVRVQESNPLHTASPTHRQHRTVWYQSPFKTNSNLQHHNVVTEGSFFQQRNRDRSITPLGIAAGLNTQRRQWYCSLNLKTKVDFLSDQAQILSTSTSQQKQAKTGLLFHVTHPRGHISGLQTRKQDQPQRHHQPFLQSHPSTEASGSKSAQTAMGAHLQPQLQVDSKPFSPGTGAKLHLQPPPRLTWMPQGHTAITRPTARHSSFNTTYGTGQQAGWRPCRDSMTSSLGRSKNMPDRHPGGYKGAGLN